MSVYNFEGNKQTKQNFFFCLCRFSMSPQVHVKHALKITCSCKSSETPSIQSDLLGSTLFQSFSIIIQPHQCPWGCCGNTTKIPVMSFVCATTQQWRISKRWYTCCQTDAKCLHLIGVGLCGATFPHCRISKMAVWNFVKDLLSSHIE